MSVLLVTFHAIVGMIGIVFNNLTHRKADVPQEQVLRPSPYDRMPNQGHQSAERPKQWRSDFAIELSVGSSECHLLIRYLLTLTPNYRK